LVAALTAAADGVASPGPVVTTDLFYDGAPGREERWLAAGALAVEMEAATLFALAARRGVSAAALLAVSDLVLPARQRIAAEQLTHAEQHMGRVATLALGV
jgi:purine-nucleoside phosphorylase